LSHHTDWDVSAALSGRGAERRTEQRFEVTLRGELHFDKKVVPVEIGDVSTSGAFVFVEDPPSIGCEVTLRIENFGTVEMIVMHVGKHFCGLRRTPASEGDDGLLEWARQQPAMSRAHPWSSAPASETV
jgi:PilZ domain